LIDADGDRELGGEEEVIAEAVLDAKADTGERGNVQVVARRDDQ